MQYGASDRVEATITNNGYSGDFLLDSTGDLMVSTDTYDADPATQERLIRMLFTSPRFIVNGVTIGEPDCDEFPTWGVGLPGLVDGLVDSDLQNEITSQILNGLGDDVSILNDPSPTVDFSLNGVTLSVLVTYTRNTGSVVSLPLISFTISGG